MDEDKKFGLALGLVLMILVAVMMPLKVQGMPNCEHHTDDDRIALACNIYWEARTESVEGMMAVVAVTMNRVNSPKFPDTVSEVVWQYKQFSWTRDGLPDRPRHAPSWRKALAMASRFTVTREKVEAMCPTAHQIMAGMIGRPDPGCAPYRNLVNIHILLAKRADPTLGSLYYHADYVQPYWVLEDRKVAKIGRHIFYTAAKVRRY
jgi:spore germination cell wall hydrolase CwlJ-like protein